MPLNFDAVKQLSTSLTLTWLMSIAFSATSAWSIPDATKLSRLTFPHMSAPWYLASSSALLDSSCFSTKSYASTPTPGLLSRVFLTPWHSSFSSPHLKTACWMEIAPRFHLMLSKKSGLNGMKTIRLEISWVFYLFGSNRLPIWSCSWTYGSPCVTPSTTETNE